MMSQLNKLDELKETLCGVNVVMITPFKGEKENYALDEEGLKKFTRFLIDSGIVKGKGVLIPAGSTGECPMLSDEERFKVYEIVKKEAGDRVPIIGGANHTDPRAVIKFAKYAEEIGLDGIMVAPPYYWKANEKIVMEFFRAITKEVNMGIMVYNNWFITQYDIPLEVLDRMTKEFPQIVAIKDNTPILSKLARTVETLGERIVVLNGLGEPQEPYASQIGTKGFMSATSCVIPQTCLRVYEEVKKGYYEEARKILDRARPLMDFLLGGESAISYISRIKAAMNFIGLPGGVPRPPLSSISNQEKEELRTLLNAFSLPELWNN